jgi:elongation factor G
MGTRIINEIDKLLSKLRNIGIAAHIDAGKTTTTERMLFYAKQINRIGEVHDGESTMDWMAQEKERGITITSASTFFTWNGAIAEKENNFKLKHDTFNFNIIDTPGHVDFTIEVERSLRVLDGAILLLEGVSGVQTQTVTVNRQANKYKLPRIVFINKMDRLGANFFNAVQTIPDKLCFKTAILQLPVGEENNFNGIVDLVSMKYFKWNKDSPEKYETLEIPADMQEIADKYRNELLDLVAAEDDALLEKFLAEGDLSQNEIEYLIRLGTLRNNFFPVLCGSSYKNIGVQTLLDAVIKYLPSPLDKDPIVAKYEDKTLLITPDSKKTVCGYAFKLMKDKYAGTLCFVRIYQGIVKQGMMLYNSRTGKKFKVRLVLMKVNKREEVDQVTAGAIVAFVGAEDLVTGDTFWEEETSYSLEGLDVPEKVINLCITPETKNDYDKLAQALHVLMKEDPSFSYSIDSESGETIIAGMGELHLEIKVDILLREYGIKVKVGQPRVAYRETIVFNSPDDFVEHTYVHKKQSGGRGQFAILSLRAFGAEVVNQGFVFKNKIVGGVIPLEYIEPVRKGIEEASKYGPITYSQVIGFGVEVFDGVTHDVDSSSLAFTLAARSCFREMLEEKLNVKLLEPVMSVTIEVPSDFMGVIVGDVSAKRGQIVSIDDLSNNFKLIDANIPLGEMFGYINHLREKTQGKGTYAMKFKSYELVPDNIAAALSKKLKCNLHELMKKNS